MMEKYHMHLQEREIKDVGIIREILHRGKYAVLAMCRNNEPYVVTLNYGYDPSREILYFHSAPKGLKLDIIAENPRICATVIDDLGYLDGKCAHAYRSVVLFGRMSVVESPEEKRNGMKCMLHQLEPNPQSMEERLLNSGKFVGKTTMLALTIESLRAKEGQ
jgi:uncharacterized protein